MTKKNSSPLKYILVVLSWFCAAGVFFIVLLNLMVLPGAIDTAEVRMSAILHANISVNRALYVPLAGLRCDGVQLSRLIKVADRKILVRSEFSKLIISIDIPGYLFHRTDTQWIRKVEAASLDISAENSMQVSVQPDVSKAAAVSGEISAVFSGKSYTSKRNPGFMDEILWEKVGSLAEKPYFPGKVSIDAVSIELQKSDTTIQAIPDFQFALNHEKQDSVLNAEFSGGCTGRLHLNYQGKSAEGTVAVSGINPGELASISSRFSDKQISGRLSLSAELRAPVPGIAGIKGSVTLHDGAVLLPSVSEQPVVGINAEYGFDLTWDAQAPMPPPRILGQVTGSNPAVVAENQDELRRERTGRHGEILMRRGQLRFNGVEAEVLPALRGIFPGEEPGYPRFDLRVNLPETEVQSLANAVPAKLMGPFRDMVLKGTLAWSLDLEVPLGNVGEMNWRTSHELNNFGVESFPEELNIYRLSEGFIHYIPGTSLYLRALPQKSVGFDLMLDISEHTPGWIYRHMDTPGAVSTPAFIDADSSRQAFGLFYGGTPLPDYRYVYLENISPWIIKSVLTAEDGDFFFHDGINWYTFKNAVARNLAAGDIELGASTLTMQLIKNLFLTMDREYVRKLHEAFLVFIANYDAGIPRERILELYLNMVEFGPDIYGVDYAARYYFGKSAADVSLIESVWLASVLPSPRRYHRYYEDGAVTDYWRRHMNSYLDIMLERERISQKDYDQAVSAPLIFKKAE